ncbi:MAG: hypothetical protein NOF05_07950 [Candidatus Accumulibacter phosphatis]|nr:hypothetical protein [Candidatus Accumulibacter phosphatis]
MTVTLTTYAIEAMGFREVVAQGDLAASFFSVTVYEARSITVPTGFSQALQARVAGANYRVAIAQSVNAGCRALTGDDFDESETDWCKRVKSNGPYVLIGVGPTDFFGCTAGRLMRHKDGTVTTYDSFPHVRDALRSLEQRVIPPVLAAVTCALNEPGRYVSLRKLERASSGRCLDGTPLHDIRLDVKADVYVSHSLDQIALCQKLVDATAKAPALNQRAARFFALGVGEDDQLKRFLYFFLALEVETHAVFGRIDHETQTTTLLSGVTSTSTAKLIEAQVASLGNLFDRFVWCAACIWRDLAEEDITLFKELKGARDAIAHGRESEPPAGFARSAEILAYKILWR